MQAAIPEVLTCDIAYRPLLDWNALQTYLVGRAALGVEAAEENSYLRTVRVGNKTGWLRVCPVSGRNALRVELSATLIPILIPVLAGVKRVFDLNAEPQTIAAQLGPLVKNPGLRVPGAFDGFEMTVRAILGQQVSVKAATTLMGRFAAAFGERFVTPYPMLNRLTPTAERVALASVDEIAALGIVGTRANSIRELARAVATGTLSLEPGCDVPKTLTKLKELPGIGEWTAQYVAMRALSWLDAFPHTDLGIQKALNETNPKRVLEIAEAWRPWRAYATMHLWNSLSETRTFQSGEAPREVIE